MGEFFVYHLMGISYGWTIRDTDKLTWPEIRGLLEQIRELPPVSLILKGMLNPSDPRPLSQQLGTAGMKTKKGRVKRRK